MTSWLTRSLSFIAVGGTLAFAVTGVRAPYVDLQTAGVVLLLVGLGDMVLNLVLLGQVRGWWSRAVRGWSEPEPYVSRERGGVRDPDDTLRLPRRRR